MARECAEHGYDLLIAADESEINEAAARLRQHGTKVDAVQTDLSGRRAWTPHRRTAGQCWTRTGTQLPRPGSGLVDPGGEYELTGTLLLVQKVGSDMRQAGSGWILITGSIAGFMPGTFQQSLTARRRSWTAYHLRYVMS
jgi:short-subunit dehydrogenase